MKTAQEIFALNDAKDIVTELTKTAPKANYVTLKKQYETKLHDVFDPVKRPDKIVQKKTIEVSRIGFNYQKKIVESSVAFLFTNPVTLHSNQKDSKILPIVEHILEKNKAYSINRKLARILFKETEVAEYWYAVEDESFWNETEVKSKIRPRCQLFHQSNGDMLFPYFNEYGDMIAFSRQYEVIVDKKPSTFLDVFTADFIKKYNLLNGQWTEVSSIPNPIKKIPIVYYSQNESEWEDVQSHIDRVEKLVSNFGDTNDYFGSPMIKLKGKVNSLPDKGEGGKVIQLAEGAEAEYLTWTQAPEAIKAEYEILRSQIFSGTNTPNLSFENLQNLGNISGITLKLMFLDSHLKAQNKLEVFDEAFVRRLSILKSFCSIIQVSVAADAVKFDGYFKFTPFLPENKKEIFDNLALLTNGRQLISQRTAISMTGLVDNIETEISEIKKDSVTDIGESFE